MTLALLLELRADGEMERPRRTDPRGALHGVSAQALAHVLVLQLQLVAGDVLAVVPAQSLLDGVVLTVLFLE